MFPKPVPTVHVPLVGSVPCGRRIYLARAPGFEPRSKVLETSILPLNYARVQGAKVGIPRNPYTFPMSMIRYPGEPGYLMIIPDCLVLQAAKSTSGATGRDYFNISVT